MSCLAIAAAQQDDYFSEIYVPENLQEGVHGKLTEVREQIQFQFWVNSYFHVDLIKFCKKERSIKISINSGNGLFIAALCNVQNYI